MHKGNHVKDSYPHMDCPLVNQQFAIEQMAIEIVDLPSKSCDFP